MGRTGNDTKFLATEEGNAVINRGGRKKGVQPKVNQTTRECLKVMIGSQLPYIIDTFDKLRDIDPYKYLSIYVRFCELILPKQQQIEVSQNGTIDVDATVKQMQDKLFEWREDDKEKFQRKKKTLSEVIDIPFEIVDEREKIYKNNE